MVIDLQPVDDAFNSELWYSDQEILKLYKADLKAAKKGRAECSRGLREPNDGSKKDTIQKHIKAVVKQHKKLPRTAKLAALVGKSLDQDKALQQFSRKRSLSHSNHARTVAIQDAAEASKIHAEGKEDIDACPTTEIQTKERKSAKSSYAQSCRKKLGGNTKRSIQAARSA